VKWRLASTLCLARLGLDSSTIEYMYSLIKYNISHYQTIKMLQSSDGYLGSMARFEIIKSEKLFSHSNSNSNCVSQNFNNFLLFCQVSMPTQMLRSYKRDAFEIFNKTPQIMSYAINKWLLDLLQHWGITCAVILYVLFELCCHILTNVICINQNFKDFWREL